MLKKGTDMHTTSKTQSTPPVVEELSGRAEDNHPCSAAQFVLRDVLPSGSSSRPVAWAGCLFQDWSAHCKPQRTRELSSAGQCLLPEDLTVIVRQKQNTGRCSIPSEITLRPEVFNLRDLILRLISQYELCGGWSLCVFISSNLKS